MALYAASILIPSPASPKHCPVSSSWRETPMMMAMPVPEDQGAIESIEKTCGPAVRVNQSRECGNATMAPSSEREAGEAKSEPRCEAMPIELPPSRGTGRGYTVYCTRGVEGHVALTVCGQEFMHAYLAAAGYAFQFQTLYGQPVHNDDGLQPSVHALPWACCLGVPGLRPRDERGARVAHLGTPR